MQRRHKNIISLKMGSTKTLTIKRQPLRPAQHPTALKMTGRLTSPGAWSSWWAIGGHGWSIDPPADGIGWELGIWNLSRLGIPPLKVVITSQIHPQNAIMKWVRNYRKDLIFCLFLTTSNFVEQLIYLRILYHHFFPKHLNQNLSGAMWKWEIHCNVPTRTGLFFRASLYSIFTAISILGFLT